MFRCKIIILCSIPLLLFGVLFLIWYKGGSEISSAYVDIDTGKPSPSGPRLLYRGIKIPGDSLVLFKKYYGIVYKDRNTGTLFSIVFEKEGYNPFFLFYEGGGIAGRGLCKVNNNGYEIMEDIHDIQEAEFYDPEGKLVSEIHDGTGIQKLYYSNGTLYWELELENFKRVRFKWWNQDGSLKTNKL